ncbi:MAG TPA: copper resistance protein CopC [Acidocella sp.]|nr:copper resistance protein CopC [Acidocella sp.]
MKKYLLLFTLAGISPAFAHAFLKQAQPAVGAVVTKPPSSLLLTFTEGLEVKFCKVIVMDSMGMHAETGAPQPVPGHANEMSVPVHFAMPGKYTVTWHALSVDTHRTEGSYSFTIGN